MSEYKEYTMMDWTLENLSRNGFAPDIVIDVGAYEGKWSRSMRPHFPNAKFLLIEAQANKKDTLEKTCRDIGAGYEICLLGKENKDSVPFCLMKTGSSIYPEVSDLPRDFTNLPMKTLDDLLPWKERRLPGSLFIKMDIQGAELDVLKGAALNLLRTEAVLMEVPLVNFNQGAPNILEIFHFMDDNNFALSEVCDVNRRVSDMLAVQADFLFLKKDHPIRRRKLF